MWLLACEEAANKPVRTIGVFPCLEFAPMTTSVTAVALAMSVSCASLSTVVTWRLQTIYRCVCFRMYCVSSMRAGFSN